MATAKNALWAISVCGESICKDRKILSSRNARRPSCHRNASKSVISSHHRRPAGGKGLAVGDGGVEGCGYDG